MKSCIPRLALAETLLLAACSDISPSTIADAVGAPEAEVGAEIQVETPAGNDAEVDGGPGPDVADLSGGPPDVASLDTSPAPPPACRVSVDALPAELNGSTPYAQGGGPLQQFRLRVPTRGFSIDVYALDAASRLATDTVVLHASAGATLKGETWPPGTNLTPQLNCAEAPDPVGWPAEALVVRHCDVPADAFAPLQGLILEARCARATAIGPPHALTVDVAVLPPALDPFPAPDPWVVVLSRDLFSHTLAAAGDGTYTLTAAYLPAGNGKADLDEALDALGLLGGDAAFNAQVRAAFLAAVRAEAHRMFVLDAAGEPTPQGAGLSLSFEGDAGAPDPTTWTPAAPFSRIAVGGDPEPWGVSAKLVGYAHVDPNNQGREDDASYGYGVFSTAIARQVLTNPAGAALLSAFSPLDGKPFGAHPDDAKSLVPGYEPPESADPEHASRHALIRLVLTYLPIAVGATLCHEMGHSLGLVPNGAPPQGLFGGMDDLSFTLSNAGSHHIDTIGLNVMQTGKVTNWGDVVGDTPRFNALNMAYLRRRLVVGPP